MTQILAQTPDFLIVATGGSSMMNFRKAAGATDLTQKVPFYQHTGTEGTLMPPGKDAPESVCARHHTSNLRHFREDCNVPRVTRQ
jgi:branched-chain amino acid transport system substrate-binding protein